MAAAVTDTSGKFTITDAPAGANVPLVIQIGKWRKQVTISTVTACADNPQPDKSLSLPANGPKGTSRASRCRPAVPIRSSASSCAWGSTRASTPAERGERDIHVFEGSGVAGLTAPSMSPAASSPASLWDSPSDSMKYDIVLLSCEGAETASMNQAAIEQYTSAGGRVFASHYHYAWFNTGPFGADNLATWTTGEHPITSTNPADLLDVDTVIDTQLPDGGVFLKGQALDKWLGVVGALETSGDSEVAQAMHNADLGAANVSSQS